MRTIALAPAKTAASVNVAVTDTPLTVALIAAGTGISPFTKFPVSFNGAPLYTERNGRQHRVSLKASEPQVGLYLPGTYTIERPLLSDNEPAVGVASYDDAAETASTITIATTDADVAQVSGSTIYVEDGIDIADVVTFTSDPAAVSWTYTAIGTALDAGITFDTAAVATLDGVPTTPGTYYGLVIARDAGPTEIGRTYVQIVVKPAVELLVGTVAITTAAYRGIAYASPAITVENGTAPYTFTNTGDALPAGLALTAGTGEITGVPTTAGAATAGELTVTDAVGRTATIAYSIDVDQLTVTETYPNGTEDVAYDSSNIVTSGGLSPYVTYAVIAGAVPTGMTFTNAGRLHGTTVEGGAAVYNFTIRATDGRGMTGDVAASVEIVAD